MRIVSVERSQLVVRATSTSAWSYLSWDRWFTTPGPVDVKVLLKVTDATGVSW